MQPTNVDRPASGGAPVERVMNQFENVEGFQQVGDRAEIQRILRVPASMTTMTFNRGRIGIGWRGE